MRFQSPGSWNLIPSFIFITVFLAGSTTTMAAEESERGWKKWFDPTGQFEKAEIATAAGLSNSAAATRSAFLGDDALTVRGLVRPKAEAAVSTDLIAKVVKVPYTFGKSFKKGQSLVIFQCDRHRAELAAAKAELRSQKIVYGAKQHLRKHNAAGRNEVSIALAKRDKAQADVDALQARIRQCEIKAPYDGRIVEQLIHEHEVPKPNSPILKIINDEELKIELIVPSKWLGWLRPGADFTFTVEETGQTITAKVAEIGAAVDPVSQTVKITGQFPAKPVHVLAGMTGAAKFRR